MLGDISGRNHHRGKGLSQDDAGGGGGRRENTCAWFRAKTKSSSIRGLAGEA